MITCISGMIMERFWQAKHAISRARINQHLLPGRNSPARLVGWWSWRQGLHWKQLLAALHGVDAGTSQSERRGGARDPHPDRDDQRLRYVAQLLHSVRQQCLEHSLAFPNWLRNEVAKAKRTILESFMNPFKYTVLTFSQKNLRRTLWKSKSKRTPYFFFLDEAISTLRMTKTRATERKNLMVTAMASSRRPGVYLFWSSFTRVPSRVSRSFKKL